MIMITITIIIVVISVVVVVVSSVSAVSAHLITLGLPPTTSTLVEPNITNILARAGQHRNSNPGPQLSLCRR